MPRKAVKAVSQVEPAPKYKFLLAMAALMFGANTWKVPAVASRSMSTSVTESVAEILGLNDATPAPTISVPDDIPALVAVPDVALSCKLAKELASLAAAVVTPITTL